MRIHSYLAMFAVIFISALFVACGQKTSDPAPPRAPITEEKEIPLTAPKKEVEPQEKAPQKEPHIAPIEIKPIEIKPNDIKVAEPEVHIFADADDLDVTQKEAHGELKAKVQITANDVADINNYVEKSKQNILAPQANTVGEAPELEEVKITQHKIELPKNSQQVWLGDHEVKCEKTYNEDQTLTVKGACLNKVTVEGKHKDLKNVFVNEIPMDPTKIITFEQLLKGLGNLEFDDVGTNQKKLIDEFLKRSPSFKATSVQMVQVLSFFKRSDQRIGIINIFKDNMLDPDNTKFQSMMDKEISSNMKIEDYKFIDLRDLIEFSDKYKDMAQAIWMSFGSQPKSLLGGVKKSEILNIQIVDQKSESDLTISVFVDRKGEKAYRFYDLHLDLQSNTVANINLVRTVPISEIKFSVKAALVQRKVWIESSDSQIKHLFPIGVGGFDFGLQSFNKGKTRLLTPTFHNAFLTRTTAIEYRSTPQYYQNRPFIPVVRSDGIRTPFSFHIYQFSDDEKDQLERGFISHGCMHLRLFDLLLLLDIVKYSGLPATPLEVSYYIPLKLDHPYPMFTEYYEVVQDCAKNGESPHSCMDPDFEEKLILLDEVYEPVPPIEKLDLFGIRSSLVLNVNAR